MKNPKLIELKATLKGLAAKLKLLKPLYRACESRAAKGSTDSIDSCSSRANKFYDILAAQRKFRHAHIAYCLLRGRTREQIERPKPENKPDETLIAKYLAEYSVEVANV